MEPLTIGRSADNHLVVKHPRLSARHCQVSRLNDEWLLLEDLESDNGTFVNNRQIVRKQIRAYDRLRLADKDLETALLFRAFLYTNPPSGLLWEDFVKQEKVIEDFQALEKVYEEFMEDKLKILQKNLLKSTGLRAGLSIIPLIGAPLGILTGALTNNTQKALLEREERFKTEFVCPACYRFLGEPFANLKKRGYCVGCKASFVRH